MAALSPSLLLARARWQLARWRRLPGFAPAMLGASLLLLGLAWLGWQQARGQWRAQQALADAASPPAVAARPALQARRSALREFYAALPTQDELPTMVQSLLDLADKQGLRVARGNYRLEAEPAAPMARFRVSIPLRGEPARVQRFVLAALQAHPTLALDGLQLKRDADGNALIEAKVQFVMFLQAGPVPPASSAEDGLSAVAAASASLAASRSPAP